MINVINASTQPDNEETNLSQLQQLVRQDLKERSIIVQGYAAYQNEDQQINDACLRIGQDLTTISGSSDISLFASLLAISCQKNNRQVLPKKFDINGHNELGDTALTQAAYYGNKNKVKILLSLGADVHAQAGEKRYFRTPLQAAQEPLFIKTVGGLDFSRSPLIGDFLKPLTPIKVEQVNKSEIINILSGSTSQE